MSQAEIRNRILSMPTLQVDRLEALQSYNASEAIVEALFAIGRFVGGKTRFAPPLRTQGAAR